MLLDALLGAPVSYARQLSRSVRAAHVARVVAFPESTSNNLRRLGLDHRAADHGRRHITRGGAQVATLGARQANVLVRALDAGVPEQAAVWMAVAS